ncbi:hypothetical protein HMPREF1557_00183 [Streptococcus sobrinus W1703]|uniref:Uncharacterized protein n=1 Tax=Streptococcus sobrinus W1703 TaxID=1227275 RepID=U2KNY6_9STRE|nr:hypothetical protein HMPREF1557_00183 [Streptococcus sobrinus W1703]
MPATFCEIPWLKMEPKVSIFPRLFGNFQTVFPSRQRLLI